MKLLVYASPLSSRARYIFKLVLGNLTGWAVETTTSIEEVKAFSGPVIIYSKSKPEAINALHVAPAGLLEETGISKQNIRVDRLDGLPVFFQTQGGDLNFDPFAAAFYLVSRYEEYRPFQPDAFGRFPAKESLAWKEGFLDIPVVNHYQQLIWKLLEKKYPGLEPTRTRFTHIPTYDIDLAWNYRNKGVFRNIGTLLLDIRGRNWKGISSQIQSHLRIQDDPYDTYPYIESLHPAGESPRPVWFFQLGNYGRYDKNVSYRNPELRNLILRLSEKHKVGIHPSVGSNESPLLMEKEIKRLSGIIHGEVVRSRQHYLILKMPHTYRNLLEFGVKEDFTMAFPEAPGFRAGIANSFFFYDLAAERVTDLKIFPFQLMDATLFYYLNLSPKTAIEHSLKIIDRVREVNGLLVTLWHNNFLSEYPPFIGWRSVYEHQLESIRQAGGRYFTSWG